jgi:DNA-binding MarR family transcriptional regulator
MSVLSRRSGLSSAQLARRAFVSAQAMNQIIGALERQGFVERAPDPDNARILRAKLTEQGRAVLSACDRATAQVERSLLGKLSPTETKVLRRTLESCATALAERARSPVA